MLKDIPANHKSKRWKTKRIEICQCDFCGCEFQRKHNIAVFKETQNEFTFCNRNCQHQSLKKNGKLYFKTAESGIWDVWQEKVKQILKEKYGVENPSQLPDHQKKSIKTMQERYGVDNGLQLPLARQRTMETAYTEAAQNKKKQTNLIRYGHEKIGSAKQIIQKRNETILKRYGVNNAYKIPEVISRSKAPSKPENKLFEILKKHFDVVEREKPINGQAIDFFIADINTYVQSDGVFWHGLDMPIEEIKKLYGPRNQSRVNTYYRDLEQNKWFQENNLRLVRITDKQIKELSEEEILKIIIS